MGIEEFKLARILCCLCSIGIFTEPEPGYFANNHVSKALHENEPLRAYILLFGLDLYTASDHLPTTLLSKDKGVSYDVDKTAVQNAVGTTKTRWDWLEEKAPMDELRGKNGGYPGAPELVPLLEKAHENVNSSLTGGGSINGNVSNDAVRADSLQQDLHSRPEHAIFGLAMIGGTKRTSAEERVAESFACSIKQRTSHLHAAWLFSKPNKGGGSLLASVYNVTSRCSYL
ncbi:hypothetical protein MaudCBS49596_006810 [Microsporum audouinii]